MRNLRLVCSCGGICLLITRSASCARAIRFLSLILFEVFELVVGADAIFGIGRDVDLKHFGCCVEVVDVVVDVFALNLVCYFVHTF